MISPTQPSKLDDVLQQKNHASEVIYVEENVIKLVIFSLEEEWYAFYGKNILEILPKETAIFFVPGCPSTLLGVINLRGSIESVIDLGIVLQLRTETISAKTILLAKGESLQTGICVDTVIDVLDIRESDIKVVTEPCIASLQAYVIGAFMFAKKAVTLLNLEKILTDYQQDLA